LQELQHDAPSSSVAARPSQVAAALGTTFNVRPSPPSSARSQETPPNFGRRGAEGLQTWMDKSPFWFSSLPRLGGARQGWKKSGFFIKKNQPSVFYGFFVFLGFFLFFFCFFFVFLYIFAQKREFLGSFQFQEYFVVQPDFKL
jgi:hypothetical protein